MKLRERFDAPSVHSLEFAIQKTKYSQDLKSESKALNPKDCQLKVKNINKALLFNLEKAEI